MAIEEHLSEYAGQPVVEWEPEAGEPLVRGTAYRLGLSYEEAEAGGRWTDKLAAFLDEPEVGEVTGLVIGPWYDTGAMVESNSEPIIQALVAARDRLNALTALFVGDIIREECEISWIRQSDVSPLFSAYPALEHFGVRGGEGLSLGTPRHARLKSLTVQTGGLPAGIVRDLCAAELPALEHLELWLGERQYGGTTRVEDLAPILSGNLFMRLRYLGLRDSEIADEIAAAVATAPILARIRVLDLSLGTLGDQGAMSLLASPAVARLEKLDVHHHFCSETMAEKLKALGPTVDATDPQEPEEYGGDTWRYVAVGE